MLRTVDDSVCSLSLSFFVSLFLSVSSRAFSALNKLGRRTCRAAKGQLQLLLLQRLLLLLLLLLLLRLLLLAAHRTAVQHTDGNGHSV